MSKPGAEFLKRLRETFRLEAADHLSTLSAGLLAIEKAERVEQWVEIVNQVYRAAHSLKGASRAVGFADVERICQVLEGEFHRWKRQDSKPPTEGFDVLLEAIDLVGSIIGAQEQQPVPGERVESLLERLRALGGERASEEGSTPAPEPSAQRVTDPGPRSQAPDSGAAPGPAPASRGVAEPVADSVRVPMAQLDSLLLQVEELLSLKLTAEQRVVDLRETRSIVAAWSQAWTPVADQLRRLQRAGGGRLGLQGGQTSVALSDSVLGYLEWSQENLRPLEQRLEVLRHTATLDHQHTGALVDTLHRDVREIVMLPFAVFLEGFPRMVREIARAQDKQVDLVLRDDDVSADKRILKSLKDPLTHLLRNCVDHGIEPPQAREAALKPPRGEITLSVQRNSENEVELQISDDGAGIDLEAVRAAALRQGGLSEEEAEALSAQETLELIFRPEVTTSRMITDLSGRGLGLAIVREGLESIGGRVTVASTKGRGTTFRLFVPVTLATFRGIVVTAGEQTFVLPTVAVSRVLQTQRRDIKTVENLATIEVDGGPKPLIRLRDVLGIPGRSGAPKDTDNVTSLVLGQGTARIAFEVSSVKGEQEILVKSLGTHLPRLPNIAGATVLGSGQLALILSVPDLFRAASRVSTSAGTVVADGDPERAVRSILLVEDTITSRMLLQNVLQAAGYRVATAVDGADGWAALKLGDFDLAVLDVEMPRMDGFELTEKIRADETLAKLPVVLVTAREAREDRERGIDVGANAYIIKSTFDQGKLLDVIRRLL